MTGLSMSLVHFDASSVYNCFSLRVEALFWVGGQVKTSKRGGSKMGRTIVRTALVGSGLGC